MKLLNIHYTKAPASCESCGHEIHNIYTVQDNANTLHIGSECAKPLIGANVAQVIARYERQAAKEWKERKPENEDRGTYIARRINEKRQARKAWQEWSALNAQHHWNTNPWMPEQREQAIIALEQKHGVPCSEWISKTAYTI